MKAAYINQTGPPDVITYGELPNPKPGPTECLIKVAGPRDEPLRAGRLPAATFIRVTLEHVA